MNAQMCTMQRRSAPSGVNFERVPSFRRPRQRKSEKSNRVACGEAGQLLCRRTAHDGEALDGLREEGGLVGPFGRGLGFCAVPVEGGGVYGIVVISSRAFKNRRFFSSSESGCCAGT